MVKIIELLQASSNVNSEIRLIHYDQTDSYSERSSSRLKFVTANPKVG